MVGVNTLRLKGRIIEKGMTPETLAEAIGMDKSTFYRKMKTGGKLFSVGDAHKISEVLSLTKEESMSIFFDECVAYEQHN